MALRLPDCFLSSLDLDEDGRLEDDSFSFSFLPDSLFFIGSPKRFLNVSFTGFFELLSLLDSEEGFDDEEEVAVLGLSRSWLLDLLEE